MSCRLRIAWLLLLTTGLGGCSVPTADVSGKVTADGQAVTGGSVIFSPVSAENNPNPGEPGAAEIRPDGTFSLKLKGGSAGLPKQFIVLYNPPSVRVTSKTQREIPYLGLVPSPKNVEIKPGTNQVNIELVAAP